VIASTIQQALTRKRNLQKMFRLASFRAFATGLLKINM